MNALFRALGLGRMVWGLSFRGLGFRDLRP